LTLDSDVPVEPDGVAVLLDELKPRRYAALALVTNVLLDRVQATPLAEHYADGHSYYPSDPYRRMRGYALSAFEVAIEEIEDTPEYQQAAEYPRLIGGLDPDHLKTQLASGSQTATNSMLTLLRQVPALLHHHAPDSQFSSDEISTIARKSVGMPWRMAMMCVNQLMATKAVLTKGDAAYQSWAGTEPRLDPRHFKLKWRGGEPFALDFDNVSGIELPEGFHSDRDTKPLSTPSRIADIQCHREASTIGCPVTLLPLRVNGLWEWFIEGIDQRNMWEQP
jgi:hypothetical protein